MELLLELAELALAHVDELLVTAVVRAATIGEDAHLHRAVLSRNYPYRMSTAASRAERPPM